MLESSRSGPSSKPEGLGGEGFLLLFGLWNLAVGQPLFDLLGRNGAFFLAHGISASGFVVFGLSLSVGVPMALALLALGLRRISVRLHLVVMSAWVVLLATALALLASKRLVILPPRGALLLAALFGIGALLALRRPAIVSVARLTGLVSIAFPLLFIFVSPARTLWQPQAGQTPVPTAGAVGNPISVVLLVFDELPLASLLTGEGTIDASRFPNFAALAEDSLWFRRTRTASQSTEMAVPALLTGLYPDPGKLPTARDYPSNLFTLLGRSHSLNAIESLTRLCPESLCSSSSREEPLPSRIDALVGDTAIVFLHLLLPTELSGGLPSISGTWGRFGDTLGSRDVLASVGFDSGRRLDVRESIRDFLEGIASDRDPTLHYLHLEIPHIPWRFLPSGAEYGPLNRTQFAQGVLDDKTWADDDWLIAQGLQRHLLQVAYTDRVLGELVGRLQDAGLYESALLIVTADHGIAFVAGEPGRVIVEKNAAEVLSVPLFMRIPGRQHLHGTRSERYAELIDLVPTVADVLEIDELPWTADGHSLIGGRVRTSDLLEIGVEEPTVYEHQELLRQEEEAVERISRIFGRRPGIRGLFDIGPHPGLHDRRISRARARDPSSLALKLDQPWIFDRVDPDSRFVPAQVEGSLIADPQPKGRTELAIAVNGVIRATTRSYRDGETERFSAVLPEGAYVSGRNVIEVLVIEDSGATLRPTTDRSGPSYTLVRGGGLVTEIEASNGTSCTMDDSSVTGELWQQGTTFMGWASWRDGSAPFVVIMVFVDDALRHVTTTGWERPFSAAGEGDPEERSGFRFRLPEALLVDGEVRVFGVVGERGSEILP